MIRITKIIPKPLVLLLSILLILGGIFIPLPKGWEFIGCLLVGVGVLLIISGDKIDV